MNPSFTNFSEASSVPIGSGKRYLASGITSTFIQLEDVTSLANLAVKIASSEVFIVHLKNDFCL